MEERSSHRLKRSCGRFGFADSRAAMRLAAMDRFVIVTDSAGHKSPRGFCAATVCRSHGRYVCGGDGLKSLHLGHDGSGVGRLCEVLSLARF